MGVDSNCPTGDSGYRTSDSHWAVYHAEKIEDISARRKIFGTSEIQRIPGVKVREESHLAGHGAAMLRKSLPGFMVALVLAVVITVLPLATPVRA